MSEKEKRLAHLALIKETIESGISSATLLELIDAILEETYIRGQLDGNKI